MKTTIFFALLVMTLFWTNMGIEAQNKQDEREKQEKKEEKKKKTEEVIFIVNMFCENCKTKIERHLAWEKGVTDLKIDLDKKSVLIKYDPQKTDEEKLKKVIIDLEYTCEKAVTQEIPTFSEAELLNDKDYQALAAELKRIDEQISALTKEFQSADSVRKQDTVFSNRIEEQHLKLTNAYNETLRSFILKHTNDYSGLFILSLLNCLHFEAGELERLFNLFPDALKNTDLGKQYNAKIAVYKKSAIGANAPDFTLNDPADNPFSFSKFKGKYVLLDFWASWCAPCRKENPNLVKAYNRFKDENFEIVSVSLDYPTGRKNWLNAIEKDGLAWLQVSDLKGWENQAALLYSVRNIPCNFLINPEGVIIEKNLMGEKLNKKLAEILK